MCYTDLVIDSVAEIRGSSLLYRYPEEVLYYVVFLIMLESMWVW